MTLDEMKNKVILGDCLEIMKQLPDKCIDLVLTDPPYGIGIGGIARDRADINKEGNSVRKAYAVADWDDNIPSELHFKEMFRISKNQVICGGNYFVKYLQEGHKGWVIWDKGQRDLDMSDCELIYTSFDCPTRIFTLHRAKLWAEKPQHPTQKPIELIKYLVEKFSKENDLILDPFLGSGTTAIACKQLKRNFIGIEISADYCKISEERLSATSYPMF